MSISEQTSDLDSRIVFSVAAGIPPEIGDKFIAGFFNTLPIFSWLPLDRHRCYTES